MATAVVLPSQSPQSAFQTFAYTQPAQTVPNIELYRNADRGVRTCYSSIDSPNEKLRILSKLATDTIMQVCTELLRKPIVSATQITAKTKSSAEKVLLRFAPGLVRDEQWRKGYPLMKGKDGGPDERALVLPVTELQSIAQDIMNHMATTYADGPGGVTHVDLIRRTENIILQHFSPEFQAMNWLHENQKAPTPPSYLGRQERFIGSLFGGIAHEAHRRILASGFDRTWTRDLVDLFLVEYPQNPYKESLRLGVIIDMLPSLTW